MQFQNEYILNTIKDACVMQGTAPKTFFASVNIQTAKEGDWFFLLEDFFCDDDFFKKLLSKKIAVIVVEKTRALSKDVLKSNVCIITVENVKIALKTLMHNIRNDYPMTVIAVAGTMVRQGIVNLLAGLLHHVGKKTMVFAKNSSVFEMGCIILNHAGQDVFIIFEAICLKIGDMKTIAEIVRPSLALIDGIGHHNIDSLGSLSDIAAQQRSIFSFFSAAQIGIINGDQLALAAVSYAHPVIKFGFKTINQIQARKIKTHGTATSFVLKIYKQKYPVTLLTLNRDIVLAILAVVAAAKLLEISDEHILPFIQAPLATHQCFEQKILPANRGTLINDTYSTDPESMKASLLAFQNLKIEGKKVLIMGDMQGLGMSSAFWHRQIGRFLRKTPTISMVVTVGNYGNYVKKTAPCNMEIVVTKEWQEAVRYVENYFATSTALLIKGSSAQGFDSLLKHLSQK